MRETSGNKKPNQRGGSFQSGKRNDEIHHGEIPKGAEPSAGAPREKFRLNKGGTNSPLGGAILYLLSEKDRTRGSKLELEGRERVGRQQV